MMLRYFKSKEAEATTQADAAFLVQEFLSGIQSLQEREELTELVIKTCVDWAEKKGYGGGSVSVDTQKGSAEDG